MSMPDRCTRCGHRPARYQEVAVLGPLALAEHYLCVECSEDEGSSGEMSPEDNEPDVVGLGPIQFDVLRDSIAGAEREASSEVLMFVAGEVVRIAAHHNQELPTDIRAFVDRHTT